MNLREGKNGKIYYYTEGGDRLLYDFGWKVTSGTPFSYQNRNGSKVDFQTNGSYYSYVEDGHCYEYVQVEYSPFSYYSHMKEERLYMGIGLTSGIFTHLFVGHFDCYCFKDLVSVYNSENKLIYQNPLFKENGEFVTSVTSLDVQSRLSIINRGKEVEFIWKAPSLPDGEKLMIYDSTGRLLSIHSMKKARVIIKDLPVGIYIYRINEENGRFIIRK